MEIIRLIDEEGHPVLTMEGFDEELESCVQESRELREKLRALEERKQTLREMQTALERLPKSWQVRDPGKRGNFYSFLDERGRRVAVRSLLPPETRIFTEDEQEEWNQYRESRWSPATGYLSIEAVPPHVPVIPFEDVARWACPSCGVSRPLIEKYAQTFDSPMGDTWEQWLLVICCDTIHEIDHTASEYRMGRPQLLREQFEA